MCRTNYCQSDLEYGRGSSANFYLQIEFSIGERGAGLKFEIKNLFRRLLHFAMFSHSVYGCIISIALQ